ncbi:MAG TPA: hypothetical protein VMS77_06815 [Conexivisphaerales archaeon]|nr:hypothetical protein [Conexivisphaerales archaeon]
MRRAYVVGVAVGAILAAVLLLTVLQSYPPASSTVFNLTVGQAISHRAELQDPSGMTDFVANETFPITVVSPKSTDVELDITGLPDSAWASLSTNTLRNVGPSGKAAILTIFGAIADSGGPGGAPTYNVTVTAHGADGSLSQVGFSVIVPVPLTVLHQPGPLNITWIEPWRASQSGPSYTLCGAVYDPQTTSSGSLPVELTPLGMVNGSQIMPLPSWIAFTWPVQVTKLEAEMPIYFETEALLNGAPVGAYTFAFGEEIGGVAFVFNVTMDIIPPIPT